MFQKLHARIFLAAVLMFIGAPSHAAFHEWKINEVYSNADGTVQFIELTTTFGGQQFVNNRSISSIQGGSTNSFTFPGNLPGDSTNKKFLIGTTGFAALGVVAPDYIVPNGFVYTSNVTINFAGFDMVIFPSVPTDGALSVNRLNATATNSPTNFAGATGTVVLPPPSTPPGAPTIGTATPGNTHATISFTAGAAGSSPTTGFTATCTSTGQATRTGTGNASPITVSMLANGNVYSCSVTATNANGTSPASASVNVMPAAPASVPGAPLINSISPGNTQATINFSPPASDGGAAISNYIATCGAAVSSGPSSPVTVTGLTNGTSVSCTVAAVNSAGTGPQSSPVNVTPGATPGTPNITSAVAGNAQASIFFTTPADGGSAIINYGVSCNPGQIISAGPGSPITVTGLTNGIAYSCTVTAINGFGPGTASAPSAVTPSASAPLTLISVVTRKTHGATGTFDLSVDTAPVGNAISVEPRAIGAGHTIAFQFNVPITATGTVTASPVGTVAAIAAGNEVVVTLNNIADNQRTTISLVNVNSIAVNAAATLGFLIGDINNTRSVNSSDISSVKARSGQITTGSNFKFDLNATGGINSSDISAVKARSGLVLQP